MGRLIKRIRMTWQLTRGARQLQRGPDDKPIGMAVAGGLSWRDAWRLASAFDARPAVIGPRRFPLRGEVVYPGSELYAKETEN